jgi:threonylcarbamoyladenosine tRNA methylthiotransferase MtaB
MAQRFYIENFGCRATQADTAAIERQLRDRGLEFVHTHEAADVVVVNTCTVTSSADAQARQAIRKIHRENPHAKILVTGCYAQRAPEELAQIEGVHWVVGNSHLASIAGLLNEAYPSARQENFFPLAHLSSDKLSLADGPAKVLTGDIFAQTEVQVASVLGGENDRTRPVLKIQDGCNNRCAYCVIPYVRGRSRSLPPDQVLDEIRRLVDAGYKEVVLSGINLGSYGRDLSPRVEFTELIRRIIEQTELPRLRLSSIEPMDVTQDFVELVASSDRIARHFHIPLQSGSDRVLAAMHRWYRTAHYARRIELIHERLPDAAIGADVIAGFPGETEEDHNATLCLVGRLPFTYLHVFAFSERPGTAAARLKGKVEPAIIKRRSQELRALAAEKTTRFRTTQMGRILRVLTLRRTSDENGHAWTEALSDNYLKVRLPGHIAANELVDAKITRLNGDALDAQPVPALAHFREVHGPFTVSTEEKIRNLGFEIPNATIQ